MKELEVFEDLLYVDGLRGFDSTGTFLINKYGNFSWAKGAVAPYSFLRNPAWKAMKDKAFQDGLFLFGHNRKATEGNINNINAHPFVEGNTILIHNGSLLNWRSLMRHEKREKKQITVDSHLVTYLFEHENYLDVLKEIRGAFVFVWYNAQERKLRIAKNDERPLHFGRDLKSNLYYISSERGILNAIANRRLAVEVPKIEQFGDDLVHTYSIGKDFSWKYEGAEPFKEVKKSEVVIPVITTNTPPKEIPKVSKLITTGNTTLPVSQQYIPKQYQNNIYYGDEVLDSILPYQRAVCILEDYDLVANSSDHCVYTGFIVGHPKLKVRGRWNGSEEELLRYITEGKPMIGMIRRIGKLEGNQDIFILHASEVCELVSLANNKFMEKEHFLRVLGESKGNCFCQQNVDLTKSTDLIIEEGYIMCSQCANCNTDAVAQNYAA